MIEPLLRTGSGNAHGSSFILCEDKSHGHHLQDFHGFTLARDLRVKERYLGPTIMVSCLPREFFLERVEQHHEFRILQGRGTGFLDLHDINDEEKVKAVVEAIRPLSPVALMDLCSNLLDEHGYLRSKLDHDLKLHSPSEKRQAIVQEVLAILGPRAEAILPVEQQEVLTAEEPHEAAFAEAKSLALVALAGLYRKDGNSATPSGEPTGRLLLLEDDAEDRQLIEERLRPHFILDWAVDGEDLIGRLKNDKAYAYDVVLCDWRLKDAQGNWLNMQGYDVLDEAARIHPAALFALTSMDERSVHAMRNKLNARIQLMKKDHFREQSAPLVEMLRTAMSDKETWCASFPSGNAWDNKFKQPYIELRQSRDWPTIAADIGETAKEFFDKAQQRLVEQDRRGIQWYDFELEGLRYDDGLSALQSDPLMRFLVMRRYMLALFFWSAQRQTPENAYLPSVYAHGARQDGTGTDQLNRLAWLTWLLYQVREEEVDDEYDSELLEAIKAKMKNAVTNKLALPGSRLPKACILLEEQRWLRDMGIELDLQPH